MPGAGYLIMKIVGIRWLFER